MAPVQPSGHSPLALLLLLALAAALFPAVAAAEPLVETRAADLRPPITSFENRALILTPGALYRFLPESETWTSLTTEDGLPEVPLTGLSLTAEDLWITGLGCSVTDPQADDWQRYQPGEGYPGRMVYDVESDDDYAYAATDDGAARFDRYIFEWEPLQNAGGRPLGPVADVAVGEDRVWFALADGVAEYRKESESFRVDTLLDRLSSPEVLALRQTSRHVWAITPRGLARYDKDLETWTSFTSGVDLPDTRIHQATMQGDDLWLGTDAGLWRYRSASGIWRREESCDEMPGARVFSFSLDFGLWVVTEEAFAFYDAASARWIDFTTSVPFAPDADVDLAWAGGALILRGDRQLLYGLKAGQSNPTLFTYRTHDVIRGPAEGLVPRTKWRAGLDESGVGLRRSSEEYILLKGGTTVYLNDDDDRKQKGESDFENLTWETRTDLTLTGRFAGGRTLSGLYDTTDPANDAYLLSYRGTRDDILRNVSAGEIDQQFFNTDLLPDTGIRGIWGRGEGGRRSDATRRRLLTADGWAGERRIFTGRKVFYGRELTYKLDDQNLVKDSEVIRIDREILSAGLDYIIDWEGGIFAFADHVLIDDDTAIEVTYRYEVQAGATGAGAPADQKVFAGQVGMAPSDPLFVGLSCVRWDDAPGRSATTAGFNTRLEYKDADSFLRIVPEVALSRLAGLGADGHDRNLPADAAEGDATTGRATALRLRGRHRGLEVSASHRDMESDYATLEDRRTLIGRLHEESQVRARWTLNRYLQSTLEWEKVLSDQVGTGVAGADSASGGTGSESLLMAGVRVLRGGLPNVSLRRGRVVTDSLGSRSEKDISRAELEINPESDRLRALGIMRLWLRAFFQRSDRTRSWAALSRGTPDSVAGESAGEFNAGGARQITDQTFVRLNGSSGSPLAWNLDWNDAWTHLPDTPGVRGLGREQELNLNLQSLPHSALDLFLSWRSERDLSWRREGGSEGFVVSRRLNSTSRIYPGRVLRVLEPLSLRVDLNRSAEEVGGPGAELPGRESMWQSVNEADEREERQTSVYESRLQVFSWLRLVDRLETRRTDRTDSLSTKQRGERFENRFEIRPRGGLVTLRAVSEETDSAVDRVSVVSQQSRRLAAEWNQTWGGGFLTYAAFEVRRLRDYRRQLPQLRWSPKIRGTYRQERWRTDASVEVAYAYSEEFDGPISTPESPRTDARTFSVESICSIQPLRILTLSLRHILLLSSSEQANHNIDLRLTIRA